MIRVIVIVCVLYHVNDLIAALRRIPFGVKRSVLSQLKRVTGGRRALRICIPSIKSVASTSGSPRQFDFGSIGSIDSINVIAFANVKGQREFPAVIPNLQLLAGVASNRNVSVATSRPCEGIIVVIWSNGGVFYANPVFGIGLSFGIDYQLVILAPIQILQIMADFVLRIRGDILVLQSEYLLACIITCTILPGVFKIDSDGRLARIIHWVGCVFVCRR